MSTTSIDTRVEREGGGTLFCRKGGLCGAPREGEGGTLFCRKGGAPGGLVRREEREEWEEEREEEWEEDCEEREEGAREQARMEGASAGRAKEMRPHGISGDSGAS